MRMKTRAMAIFGMGAVALCAAATFLGALAGAAELKAGVARVDLTPPLEMHAPLGGYGERMNRPAEGVHDRIFAKALVLADGQQKFAIVTVDIVGFPPPLKPALVERLGAAGRQDQILLLASHSHTSIEMNAINPLNTFQSPATRHLQRAGARVRDGPAGGSGATGREAVGCRCRSERRACRSRAGTAIAAAVR